MIKFTHANKMKLEDVTPELLEELRKYISEEDIQRTLTEMAIERQRDLESVDDSTVY